MAELRTAADVAAAAGVSATSGPVDGAACDVVVLGSANADLVLSVEAIPRPGQTVLATGSDRLPGGKGANQAAAAARSGARTAFVGAVGTDADGDLLRSALSGAGVELAGLRASALPTGVAVVAVEAGGENSIVVAPGANASLTALTAADRVAIAGARILLCQLEIPLSVVIEATRWARAHAVRIVLNAAPFRPLPPELLAELDVLVVNELEARELSGVEESANLDGVSAGLLELVPAVLVTLGPAGALVAERAGVRSRVPAPAARAIDTTGAGDTFCGVLAGELARGRDLGTAARTACVAAALSVQRSGAIGSMPAEEELRAAERAENSLPAGNPEPGKDETPAGGTA